MASIKAVQHKKETTHQGGFLFCYGVLCPSTTDGGGRGLGARALAVRDEARATREKIRSLGSKQCFAPEATIFSTEVRGPMRGTEHSVEKEQNTRYIKIRRKVFEELEKLFSKRFS